MSLFCEQCGKQATTLSKFCIHCGYSLNLLSSSPTSLNLSPKAPAVAAIKAKMVSDQHSDSVETSSANARPTSKLFQPVLIMVGAAVIGVVASLALREMGALNFAFGEKVSVSVATKQAESAYEIGYVAGEIEGTKSGKELGYNSGFEAGDASGFERGYAGGMDIGFIDAKSGITPNDVGDLALTAEWVYEIGSSNEPGICLFASGGALPDWDQLKWAFISPSGSVDFKSDSNGNYNCLTDDYIRRFVGPLSRYNRLAVYIIANGKSDRWGPLQIPTP